MSQLQTEFVRVTRTREKVARLRKKLCARATQLRVITPLYFILESSLLIFLCIPFLPTTNTKFINLLNYDKEDN